MFDRLVGESRFATPDRRRRPAAGYDIKRDG
jgi:hypothetical protein